MKVTTTADVRQSLIDRREIALFDVRDEAVFAEAHPLFAACLPIGRLELDMLDRVPRLTTPVVVYDDGEGFAEAALPRVTALGYTNVSLLEGGLSGWQSAGGEIFRDVNVPSKAFGELVESQRHTPSLSASEVHALLERGADLVVLDARRRDEYETMSIPSAISVPGAELVLRAPSIAPGPDTLVVVNCAGRTRSIIGTQSLVNAGVVSRVAALRNGTIGWVLDGYTLDHGQKRVAPVVDATAAERARSAARSVALRAGVRYVTRSELEAFLSDAGRTTYRFDVRTPDEYEAGHPTGFRTAPGGQLVQEADVFAPVRGARIVLWDDQRARADMTASWLAQMAWEVYVLDAAVPHEIETGPWQPRQGPATNTSQSDSSGSRRYKRPYEGTDNPREAMQAYLDWEYGLVAQLGRDGTHGFFVI
ncbi:MAG: thiosulfate sulfurtransferase [Acidobacteria bacterium]|nr:thiosulfate sulfurtransferase [Acidobacteriota bacterium]